MPIFEEPVSCRGNRISSERLEEIAQRYLPATPGPWRSSSEGQDRHGDDSADADQDFIANARQDIPALIDEIRALRSELGRFLFL